MSTPIFSLLHATMGRPRKAVDAMILWKQRASNQNRFEYIFSCNDDDPTVGDLRMMLWGSDDTYELEYPAKIVLNHKCNGSAHAWDNAAKESSGDILIQASDDFQCPDGWDTYLEAAIVSRGGGREWRDKPIVVAINDGYRKDRLMCMAVMNRARYVQQGEFLHAGFKSVFSDDDLSYRAYRDEARGECKVVDAKSIAFRHEHYAHNLAVPYDATYAHQNSPDAYATGKKLFFERNPEAMSDGIRDWK